jgi:hypothetical protein
MTTLIYDFIFNAQQTNVPLASDTAKQNRHHREKKQ